MKKTYINPAMEIVKVQTNQMLAASVGVGGNTEQNLGRGYDFDDDEEY